MTPDQLATLRRRLAESRQPSDRAEQYAVLHGWNEALAFVERTISAVMGEPGKERPR